MNTLKLTFNTNFYHTESELFSNLITTDQNNTLKNRSDKQLQTNNDKSAISGNLIFKHKFKKARRTLSVTADWNAVNTDGKTFLNSANQIFFNGVAVNNILINQMKDYNTNTKTLSAQLIYTEPLGKKYSLELGYRLAYNYG